MPDAGSRTFVEDLAQVIIDRKWKASANCMFSNVRPGATKKHAAKNIEDLPERPRLLAKILSDAKINGQWALDADDSLEDDVTLAVGNAP